MYTLSRVPGNDLTVENAAAYACSHNGYKALPYSLNITSSHLGVGTFHMSMLPQIR